MQKDQAIWPCWTMLAVMFNISGVTLVLSACGLCSYLLLIVMYGFGCGKDLAFWLMVAITFSTSLHGSFTTVNS